MSNTPSGPQNHARNIISFFLLVIVVSFISYGATKSSSVSVIIGIVTGFFQLAITEHIFTAGLNSLRSVSMSSWGALRKNIFFWMILCGAICAVFVSYTLSPYIIGILLGPTPYCSMPQLASSSSLYIGTARAPDNQLLGISDGQAAFDTQLANAQTKQEAVQAYANGDLPTASTKWLAAQGQATNDAEARIYAENIHVLNAGQPYVNIVVAATFNNDQIGGTRSVLQGAYIAQYEFNRSHTLQVRLLIANSGNNQAQQVTCQIIHASQVASPDAPIVGIMGWSLSTDVKDSISLINQARIPMVSSSASSNILSGYPYFARINPPDQLQGQDGADYAKNILNAKKVALFEDENDAYSSSLAISFQGAFVGANHSIVADELYTVGKPQSLPERLKDALKKRPDLLYFAGFAHDVSNLLKNLPSCSPTTSASGDCPPILGGDALYTYGDYTHGPQSASGRFYFTSFAFPDEWQRLEQQHLAQQAVAQMNAFQQDYKDSFGPEPLGKGPYGYTRPDADVMQAFDALSVLLAGCNHLSTQHKPLTPDNLHQELKNMTGNQAFQGITGSISLGPNGDPINKAVLMLFIDNNGNTQIEKTWGCQIKSQC